MTVCRSSKYAIFLFSPTSSTRGVPGSSGCERGGRSLMRTESRWPEMCSVRTDPSTSFEPYSISESSPALETMHTAGLSNTNFSCPPACH
jgi:hypothetical protein